MKRLSMIAVMLLLVPVAAGAQVKPVPPAPRAPLAPPTPPTPPEPLSPVLIPSLNSPFAIDVETLKERALAMSENARMQAEQFRMSQADVQQLAERARAEADLVRATVASNFAFDFDFQDARPMAAAWAQADSERGAYDRGQSLLSQRQYEQAIAQFDKAIAAKGAHADGALYWKAFAQFKLGRSADANGSLAELQKMKDSKYLSDAKVLESEIKRMGGQAARPEAEDDEDLKLLALQGLVNSDPERAIPLVQGVLNSAGSLKLKERALFVLAQSNSPQAHTILVSIAKSGTPDLQSKAVSYLGINRGRTGGKTTIAELVEIYNSSQNDSVKRSVISAIGSTSGMLGMTYTMATTGQPVTVVNSAMAAREATNRADAAAVNAEGQTALWTIYQRESNKDLKGQILSTLGVMGAYERVIEVAKSEKDADIRNRAIRSLGNMRSEKSGAALAELYPSLPDTDAKRAAINALGNQNNAEALIAIARKESNRDLKRAIIERLVNMPKNKVAQDYLMEIIK